MRLGEAMSGNSNMSSSDLSTCSVPKKPLQLICQKIWFWNPKGLPNLSLVIGSYRYVSCNGATRAGPCNDSPGPNWPPAKPWESTLRLWRSGCAQKTPWNRPDWSRDNFLADLEKFLVDLRPTTGRSLEYTYFMGWCASCLAGSSQWPYVDPQ